MQTENKLSLDEGQLMFLLLVLNLKKKYQTTLENYENQLNHLQSSLENEWYDKSLILDSILNFNDEITHTQNDADLISSDPQDISVLVKMNDALVELLESASEEINRLRSKSN